MDANALKNVLFFKGNGNPPLALEILTELKEYLGYRPIVGHVNFGCWGDGELEDSFANHEEIKGKTLIFFECLKEESVMTSFLQLCWAAKHQYGAERIIALISFMHYRRQDREDYFHEIWRNKWLAVQMKNSGISHVILATPHSEQTGENFRKEGIVFRDVDMSDLFASRLKPFFPAEVDGTDKVKVYTPDEGSITRAIKLATRLGVGVLFSLKNRGFDNETTIIEATQKEIEEVKEKFDFFPNLEYATLERVSGMMIIMVEDEIDSGGTANGQAVKLRGYGAEKIYMVFTHAVCTNPWRRKLFGTVNPFSQVIVGNTIPRGEGKRTGGKIHDVSVANPMASELFRMLQDII
ncbi:MAG: ribose-phosphate pyrophosphokinase-like domain-containing protein [Candidatus Moraniibacteriota bacterium]